MAGKLSKARAQRTSPNVTVHVAAPPPGEPGQSAKPRRWVEWTSLVVALAAAAFAGATYIDQSGVNRITQERYERRYADRISWWTEQERAPGKSPKRILFVQNRSPVPIQKVAVSVNYLWKGPKSTLPDIGGDYEWQSMEWGVASAAPVDPGAPGIRAIPGFWASVVHGLEDVSPCTIAQFTMPYTMPDFGTVQYVDFYDPEGKWWSRSGNQLFDIDKSMAELESVSVESYIEAANRRYPSDPRKLGPDNKKDAEDCTDS